MGVLANVLLVMQATRLVSCLTITDGQANSPSCHAHPHAVCAQKAASSKWVVENFDYLAEYVFTTPAHQNSHGYVNFNLWNTAVAYTATCSATSDQLTDFFYGTQWFPCTLPLTAPAGSAVSFRFNRPTGELDINGTIVCAEKGEIPAAFHLEATTSLTLACNDVTTNNAN